MNETLSKILAFRKKIGLPTGTSPTIDLQNLRKYSRFLVEELHTELLNLPDASEQYQMAHIADCLADGMFFLDFLFCECGIHDIQEEICNEVLRSNSTKGVDGKWFDESGKMIKGPNYTPPNLVQFFGGPVDLQVKAMTLGREDMPEFVQFISRQLMHQHNQGEDSVGDFTWVKGENDHSGGGVFKISGGGTRMFIWLKKMLLGDWLMKRRTSKKMVSEIGNAIVTINDFPYQINRSYNT